MAGYLDRVSVLTNDSININIQLPEETKTNSSLLEDTTSLRDSEVFKLHQTFSDKNAIILYFQSSYGYLCTRDELVETITFLNCELWWMFIATLATVILYVLYTYSVSANSPNYLSHLHF